ncbi:sulfotransferase [Octadecabacter sp.]|nr:sulfotransferase [Octadecabacter sp.]
MIFLTGYHRTGTSSIYYDLCSRTKQRLFYPPARPLSKLINSLAETTLDQDVFYPSTSEISEIHSKVIQKFITEVYGDCNDFFLKSTDFIVNASYILNVIAGSRIIVIIRNPLPTISSLLRTREQELESQDERNQEALQIAKEYCSTYNSVMNIERKFRERIFFVKYETFCQDPREYLEPLKNFTGNNFSDTVDPHESAIFYEKYEIFTKLISTQPYWKNFVTPYTGKKISSAPSKINTSRPYNFDQLETLSYVKDNLDPILIDSEMIRLA